MRATWRKIGNEVGGGSLSWRVCVFISVAGLIAVLNPISPSGADHADTVSGVFEGDDGNLHVDSDAADDPDGDAIDWNSFTDAGTAAAWEFTQIKDPKDQNGRDDIFAGGTKQDHDPCSVSVRQGSLGGGNLKFDLDRLYLAHNNVGGDDILALAWVRTPQNSQTASAHVAYEFNQGEACDENDPDSLIERTAGDKLLVYDFEGGSADPGLKLLTWKTSGACEVSNSTPPCWGDVTDLNVTGVSEAAVNTAAVGSVFDAHLPGNLGVVEFGEAVINLTELDPNLDVCDFSGNVTGVSRSSGSSGSAQMKDKVGPGLFELPGCTQNTTITTNVRISDTATIQGFDSDFVGDHSGTLTFRLYGPDDEDCDGPPVFEEVHSNVATATIAATGFYEVPHNEEGTYRWKVDYTGDSANNPSTSGCQTEVVTINYGF